jgi:16S rRNA (uracil1498-N3)-methyltransferase
VSLARFLVPPGALARLGPGDAFTLDGDEGRHAATVRRIRAGEVIDVTDGAGAVARCSVVTAGRHHLGLRVDDAGTVPAPAVRLVLAQALAKGGRDELAVETATEVGADAIIPWQADRSVVRWQGERGQKALARWETTAREATKQSRRAWVPRIEPARNTAALAERLAEATLAVVMHEAAKQPLSEVGLPPSGSILVVIGPEGGIAETEVRALEAAGAVPVRLGPEVLRTSTAGPIALALLATRTGRWS